jgi:hypothetical protein
MVVVHCATRWVGIEVAGFGDEFDGCFHRKRKRRRLDY